MGNEICLVINNTDRKIQIDDYLEKYFPKDKTTKKSLLGKVEIIVRNEYININRSEFMQRYKVSKSDNADLYKHVSLPDDSENKVLLSGKDIDANTGFVICKGKNNQLVNEPVSKEETKNSGKWKEIKELKDHLISIVEKRNEKKPNDASAHPPPSGEGEQFGKDEHKKASACQSLENEGKNRDQVKQNNASPASPRKGEVENRGEGGQNKTSADLSQGKTLFQVKRDDLLPSRSVTEGKNLDV